MRRLVLLVATALFASTFLMTPSASALPLGGLHGQVSDAKTGAPLPSISVVATRQEDGEFFWAWNIDSNGLYDLSLPAGTYKVSFTDYNGVYTEQWADDQADEASARLIVVTDGSDTEVNASMVPLPTVSGRITDTKGVPITGYCPAAIVGDFSGGGAGGAYCTDSEGRYRIPLNWAGDFRIRFWDLQQPYADQWYQGATRYEQAKVLTAKGVNITGINAVLQPEATISVRLADERSKPIDGCVAAIDLHGWTAGSGCTDAKGDVTVHQLQAGTYVIWSYDRSYRHLTRYLGGTRTAKGAKQVTVRTGQSRKGELIKLPLGGVIAGNITDSATGGPVTSACIDVTGTTVEQPARVYGQEPTKATCTDPNGHYELVGLEAGRYPVEVLDLEGSHASVFLPSSPDAKNAQTYAVTLGKTTTLNATMVPAGSITGTFSYSDGEDHGLLCVYAYSVRTGDQIGTGACGQSGTSYAIRGLGTNNYVVKTFQQGEGYPSTYAPGVTNLASARRVAVQAGSETSGVDLVVHP